MSAPRLPASHLPPAPLAGSPEVIYGLRASLAILATRPTDLIRVAYTSDVSADATDLLKFAKARSLPCEQVDDAALARLAANRNHEGIAVETRPRRWASVAELGRCLVERRGVGIALDRLRNPYNIGAVLRSAAFFGVDAAVLGSAAPHPALAPDAVRVAEGGAEALVLARSTDLADTLSRLRAGGVQVVGADSSADRDAFTFSFARPLVLVVGHEREGMSSRVRATCDAMIAIPRSGRVESLNVAVAAGVLIATAVRASAGPRDTDR